MGCTPYFPKKKNRLNGVWNIHSIQSTNHKETRFVNRLINTHNSHEWKKCCEKIQIDINKLSTVLQYLLFLSVLLVVSMHSFFAVPHIFFIPAKRFPFKTFDGCSVYFFVFVLLVGRQFYKNEIRGWNEWNLNVTLTRANHAQSRKTQESLYMPVSFSLPPPPFPILLHSLITIQLGFLYVIALWFDEWKWMIHSHFAK